MKHDFNAKKNINGISELKIHLFLHSTNIFRSLTPKVSSMFYSQRSWDERMSKPVCTLTGFKF